MTGAVTTVSAWAPLRVTAFRALWLAVLASNVGTWMQTVGAQWLLVGHSHASTLVALVQTANTLPVLLLALPSGVLADTFDRAHLLIGVQLFQVAVGVVLTVLTATEAMPPSLLLTLTFALGAGQALTIPAYQALIPELVPREQLASASALGAISTNLARSIGPAIAGLLIAHLGIAAVFGLNALSFLVFALALVVWRRDAEPAAGPPERFAEALRAGGRYVRFSPVVRRILLRIGLFIVPASALWALLPIVAHQNLGFGAGGYGLLLAALGIGAIIGAVLLPRVRATLSPNHLVTGAGVVYGLAVAVVGLARQPVLVVLVLVPAGVAWIGVLSTANATLQLFLPGWVRARGLSIYQIVVFGGQAVAALLWGVLAQQTSLGLAFTVAAAMLVAGAAAARQWPLRSIATLDRSVVEYWPEPQLLVEPDPDNGPVLVTVAYSVSPERQAAFLEAMQRVGRSRRRTGATDWGVFRDAAIPNQFVEAYLVPSWQEHLRQHTGRLTVTDQEIEEEATSLADGPPRVAHLVPPENPNDR
jgi:MFS family permease